MFTIFGGTEARRLPGRFQMPWKGIVLAAVILIAFAGIAYGGFVVSRASENTSAPPVVPAVQQPVAQPAQQVPAAVAPVVLNYQVVWTEVKGFDPSTIPVEKGFYNGRMPDSYSYSPGNPNSFPETAAYAWKILPQLEGERADWNKNILVATARAPEDKDVVLVSIIADRNPPFILLSADGEKSWYMLNLLPDAFRLEGRPVSHEYPELGDAVTVRVTASGDEVRLYGQDARSGIHWWTATVKKSELPH